MQKRIMIPTDFQVDSLTTITQAVQDLKEGETLHVTLLHGYVLSDSISDLLFYSKANLIKKIVSKSFLEGLALLRNKYSAEVVDVQIDFFHGNTNNAFVKYLMSKDFSVIYMSDNYSKSTVLNRSFTLRDYITKNCSNVVSVTMSEVYESSHETISDLFLNSINY